MDGNGCSKPCARGRQQTPGKRTCSAFLDATHTTSAEFKERKQMNILQAIKERLCYDASTGVFTWRLSSRNSVRAGSVAGGVDREGYRRITIGRKTYNEHRLAWAYVHGYMPKDEIDHINGVRGDNRIENLREADRFLNTQNVLKRSNNKSGYLGVCFYKPTSKWRAQIRANKKSYFLGDFDEPEQAHEAYMAAKRNLHPGFTRLIEAHCRGGAAS